MSAVGVSVPDTHLLHWDTLVLGLGCQEGACGADAHLKL